MKTLALLVMVGCTNDRNVTLELGPDDHTVTTGFTCMNPAAPGQLLFEKALVGKTLTFNLVVDFIDVGDNVPSCLAEDVAATCAAGHCEVSVADAPVRFCRSVTVEIASAGAAPKAVIDYLHANFGGSQVLDTAPHHPVIVRAVATQQPCDSVGTPVGGVWSTLERSAVLGCAYSCPLDLDDVSGTVSLGINVDLRGGSPEQCVQVIDACAVFPN